jgi:hypothetical protein
MRNMTRGLGDRRRSGDRERGSIATGTSCLLLLVGLAVGAGLANGCSSGNPAAPGTGREAPTTPSGEDDGGCTGSGCGFCPQGAVCTFGGSNPYGGSNPFGGSNQINPPPVQPPSVLRTPFQPTFGPTVTASVPPPPISGGTLLVTHDGKLAIAADPDRDVVYVVNLSTLAVSSTVALEPGDEPGRLAEDGAGRIHVALRGDGALVTLDPVAGTVITRRQVCPAPRGVAWDESSDLVWVACATGELIALPSAGGAARRTVILERDLRDVIPGDGSLAVTTFRSAEVLRLAGDGTVTRRDALPSPDTNFVPHVAWRAVAAPSGAIVSVHQAESTASLSTSVQGGYGSGGCGGPGGFPGGGGPPPPPPPPPSPPVPAAIPPPPPIALDGGFGGGGFGGGCLGPESGAVLSVLTVLGADGTVTLNRRLPAALPVDVAISPDGSSVAAIAPGDGFVKSLSSVFYLDQGGSGNGWSQSIGAGAQPIAVAFGGADRLLVQTREPAQLWIMGLPLGDTKTPVTLSSVSRDDTGHDVFHTQAGGMIACASCHPEGGDDGHVWLLDGSRRRTPSLRGTIAGTAPYHWPGDQRDLNMLVSDVYTKRMSGAFLDSDQMSAIATWVQSVPAPPVPSWVDAAAAKRGQGIFARADVGCGSCHSGAKLTNNATVDVGTGGKFQVPPLVGVGWRAPLLHDGCAKTIGDRFGACATAKHGSIGALSAQDITDLTAYLETL